MNKYKIDNIIFNHLIFQFDFLKFKITFYQIDIIKFLILIIYH